MSCYNAKCQKQITNPLICKKCLNKLCSNNCIIEHNFDIHQLDNQSKYLINKLPKKECLFIRKGELVKDLKSDPLYDFKNFEYFRIGAKKQILGAGAFGEVYLAKNKVNGNQYAIKHMYKKKIIEQGANIEIVQREIYIHQRLIHENIIRLYSSHEDKYSFYLVI